MKGGLWGMPPYYFVYIKYKVPMVISYRERIVKHLQQTRPDLSASSLKTYSSVLYNLHKNMHGSIENIDWFSTNIEDILKHLADKNKSTQKSTLSALFVLTGKPIYREEMMKQSREINKLYKEQKKTEKQERNWLSTDEIKSKYDSLHEKVKDIFSKKMVGDVGTIIDYLLVALLCFSLWCVNTATPFARLCFAQMAEL